jgi:hypothetical protein
LICLGRPSSAKSPRPTASKARGAGEPALIGAAAIRLDGKARHHAAGDSGERSHRSLRNGGRAFGPVPVARDRGGRSAALFGTPQSRHRSAPNLQNPPPNNVQKDTSCRILFPVALAGREAGLAVLDRRGKIGMRVFPHLLRHSLAANLHFGIAPAGRTVSPAMLPLPWTPAPAATATPGDAIPAGLNVEAHSFSISSLNA